MSNFQLLAAMRTIEKNMAFVLYRLLFCAGAALGYALATLAGAGTLIGVASLTKNPGLLGPIGALSGFAAFAYLMFRVRAYWLYAVDARQLALLAEQARGGAVPEGRAQVDYSRQRVARSFPGVSELAELDRLLRASLADIPRLLPVAPSAPQPPLLAKARAWIIERLSALNHQTFIGLHFYRDADNAWATAAAGVALQATHFPILLRHRLYASLFEWAGFIAGFAVLSIPFANIGASLPLNVWIWPSVFALVFAWALKAAFFEPIAQAAMMQSVFALAGGETAQIPALEQGSEAYREILRRAGQGLEV